MSVSKMLRIAVMTIVLASPLLGAAAMAQPGDRGADGHRKAHQHHSRSMVSALDLEDYQADLLRSGMENAKQQRRQLGELRQQMKELSHSGNYSEGEATAIANQIGQLATEHALAESRAQHDFYQSLSEEQKAKLAEIAERRESRKSGSARPESKEQQQ